MHRVKSVNKWRKGGMIHTGNALEKKKELKRTDFFFGGKKKDITASFSILSTVNIIIRLI